MARFFVVDTAADLRLRADRSRGGAFTIVLLTAMLALGYIGINLLYERVKPSPEQIFDSLVATDFEQPLPPGLSASRGSVNADARGGFTSVLLDLPQDPPNYEGPEAVISYQVGDDRQEIHDAFNRSREGHLVTAEAVGDGRIKIDGTHEVDSLPLAEENYCVVINGRND